MTKERKSGRGFWEKFPNSSERTIGEPIFPLCLESVMSGDPVTPAVNIPEVKTIRKMT